MQPAGETRPEGKIAAPLRAKLTKQFLMAQKAGTYIVSNCYNMIGPEEHVPCFAEPVADLWDREAQWARVKASYADGRLCMVFQGSDDHNEWISRH